MDNGARGSTFERRSADLLRALGYYVIRAAGSHGVADLVAVRPGSVLFVQCKISGRLDSAAWNDLHRASIIAGATAVLATRGAAPRYHVHFAAITGPAVARGRTSQRPSEPLSVLS